MSKWSLVLLVALVGCGNPYPASNIRINNVVDVVTDSRRTITRIGVAKENEEVAYYTLESLIGCCRLEPWNYDGRFFTDVKPGDGQFVTIRNATKADGLNRNCKYIVKVHLRRGNLPTTNTSVHVHGEEY